MSKENTMSMAIRVGPVGVVLWAAGHYWYLSSDWQDNAAKLYAMAAEVAKKAGSAR